MRPEEEKKEPRNVSLSICTMELGLLHPCYRPYEGFTLHLLTVRVFSLSSWYSVKTAGKSCSLELQEISSLLWGSQP